MQTPLRCNVSCFQCLPTVPIKNAGYIWQRFKHVPFCGFTSLTPRSAIYPYSTLLVPMRSTARPQGTTTSFTGACSSKSSATSSGKGNRTARWLRLATSTLGWLVPSSFPHHGLVRDQNVDNVGAGGGGGVDKSRAQCFQGLRYDEIQGARGRSRKASNALETLGSTTPAGNMMCKKGLIMRRACECGIGW